MSDRKERIEQMVKAKRARQAENAREQAAEDEREAAKARVIEARQKKWADDLAKIRASIPSLNKDLEPLEVEIRTIDEEPGKAHILANIDIRGTGPDGKTRGKMIWKIYVDGRVEININDLDVVEEFGLMDATQKTYEDVLLRFAEIISDEP